MTPRAGCQCNADEVTCWILVRLKFDPGEAFVQAKLPIQDRNNGLSLFKIKVGDNEIKNNNKYKKTVKMKTYSFVNL